MRKITLVDSGDRVEMSLFVDEAQILNYVNADTRPVRIRVSLPEKETFLGNLRRNAEFHHSRKSLKQQLESYVRFRERDIFDQVQEIRKAARKIERQLKCISLANQFAQESEETER